MSQTRIVKVDEERQYVFGWASVSIAKNGEMVEDSQGDVIELPELEEAAYHFSLDFGLSGAMHLGEAVGSLIESFVVTPEKLAALGLAADVLPYGWWVGFHIEDYETFAKIKKGEYSMFSIQGQAVREEVV